MYATIFDTSKYFFGDCAQITTFTIMAADKNNNLLSLRQVDGENTKGLLILLAEEKKWSFNQYAMEVLREHVKKTKPKPKRN